MAKILLVEDDPRVAESISQWLTHQRYVVEIAATGPQAEDLLASYRYDVLIVDWGLPGKSGVDVCKSFRERGGRTPILMLTAKSTVEEKTTGLDAGADDYVTKPVDVRELGARLRALLRRPEAVVANELQVGELCLDRANCSVVRDGETIQLTNREYALLEFLMRHPGQYFTAETLLERVWSSEIDTTALSVRVCIKRLRDKIDVDGESYIENSKGLGYRLVERK